MDDTKYIILTEEEANELAKENILDSLWAFKADFIIDHTALPRIATDMLKEYCLKHSNDANETIRELILDEDKFVEDAMDADGRGHFMNSYDGEEHEVCVGSKILYVYRIK